MYVCMFVCLYVCGALQLMLFRIMTGDNWFGILFEVGSGNCRCVPYPRLRRDWARPCHIRAGMGLSPLPHLRRDLGLTPCHICTGTRQPPAAHCGVQRALPGRGRRRMRRLRRRRHRLRLLRRVLLCTADRIGSAADCGGVTRPTDV